VVDHSAALVVLGAHTHDQWAHLGFFRSSVSGRSKVNFVRYLSFEVVVDIHELSERAKASTVSRNATQRANAAIATHDQALIIDNPLLLYVRGTM